MYGHSQLSLQKKIGHPAPFPIELPHRLINLYSYKDDVVLDPFCGSGTTCLSALQNNRNFIGYDNVEEYVNLANNRISGIVQMFGGKKISTITYHHIKKKIINYKLTNTNPILITKNNMNTHK